jgi:uncharacterized membrane protein YgcG
VVQTLAPVTGPVTPIVTTVVNTLAPVTGAVTSVVTPIVNTLTPVRGAVAPVLTTIAHILAPVTSTVAPVLTTVVTTPAATGPVAPVGTSVVPPQTSGRISSSGPGLAPQSAPRSGQVIRAYATIGKATASPAQGTGAFAHSPSAAGGPVSPAPVLPRPAAAPGGAGGAGGAGGSTALGGGANGGSGAQGTACAALLALLTLILLRLARRPAAASVWRCALPEVSPA